MCKIHYKKYSVILKHHLLVNIEIRKRKKHQLTIEKENIVGWVIPQDSDGGILYGILTKHCNVLSSFRTVTFPRQSPT